MWVLSFYGKENILPYKKENLILKAGMVGKITSLGISGFVMQELTASYRLYVIKCCLCMAGICM